VVDTDDSRAQTPQFLLCAGQEVTSGIVGALGWELSDELLTMEVVWLASNSAESTCPAIGGSLLGLVKYIL